MTLPQKEQIKITGVDIGEFILHPEIEKFNYFIAESGWRFSTAIIRREKEDAGSGRQYDELEIIATVDMLALKEDAILVHATVTTHFETKRLKRHQVTEDFWHYINMESIRHVSGYMAYKLQDTPFNYRVMPPIEDRRIHESFRENLNKTWT